MKKTLVEVYGLAVCFVAVVAFLISLGIGIYQVVRITHPEFTMESYVFQKYQSNQAFREQSQTARIGGEESEADLTKRREEGFALALMGERREGAQNLFRASIVLVLSMAVYGAHWLIARHARRTAQLATPA